MKPLSTASLLAAILLVLAVGRGFGRDDDKITKKLDAAKEKFEKEMGKVREEAKKIFDAKEDKARKATKNNKKLLDDVNDERKAFDEFGILSGDKAYSAVANKLTALHRELDGAYATAIDAYVRGKKDDLATAAKTEREQNRMKKAIRLATPGNLWIPIFNGMDTRGWTEYYPSKLDAATVEKNILQLSSKKSLRYGLQADPIFDDFHFRTEFKITPDTRCDIHLRGYDIRFNDPLYPLGTITHQGLVAKPDGKGPNLDDWIVLEVSVVGPIVSTKINGVASATLTDDNEKRPTRGTIMLEVSGERSQAQFRKVEVMPVPPAQPAPKK